MTVVNWNYLMGRLDSNPDRVVRGGESVFEG
jgi:hypothetical protein